MDTLRLFLPSRTRVFVYFLSSRAFDISYAYTCFEDPNRFRVFLSRLRRMSSKPCFAVKKPRRSRLLLMSLRHGTHYPFTGHYTQVYNITRGLLVEGLRGCAVFVSRYDAKEFREWMNCFYRPREMMSTDALQFNIPEGTPIHGWFYHQLNKQSNGSSPTTPYL